MGCAFTGEIKEGKEQKDRRSRLKTIDCRRQSTKIVDMIVENVRILSQNLTSQQVQYCNQCLAQHPLFSGLDTEQRSILCTEMVWVGANKDQYLFLQGQAGHSFFIIQKGTVEVEVDGKKVGELKEKQAFGELALLFRASRAASIRCTGQQNRFFVMKPSLYRSILKQLKQAEYTKKKDIIQKIGLFQCLTNKQKFNLANHIKSATFKAGDIIFDEGQISNGIYIISEGIIEITLPGKPPMLLSDLEVFGESALQQNNRRRGRAVCKQNSKCLLIGRKDIERSIGSNFRTLLFYNLQKWALLRSEEFKEYSNSDMGKIIMGFECLDYEDNDRIKCRGLLIALEGGINGQPEGTLFNVSNWKLKNWNCGPFIKNGAGCVGFMSFEKLSEIVSAIENRKKLIRASQKCIGEREDNLSVDDFEVVKKLGEGQFGQVFLIKNASTGGGLFAVKCLSKQAIKEEEMEQSVVEEKKILEKAIFPYIVGFVKAYHDKKNIFLVMEYLKGKQLFEVIREMPQLSKPIARYYFGCLLLSIEYLHANNIIYRDIKPENSVVDSHGKAYLIDMGTAKELKPDAMFKTWTIIGTPHYMAPEIFEGKGYSFEADYWSLGILLYEFVCGRLPFAENVDKNPYKIFSVIKKEKLQFPKLLVDQKVKKLISFILVKDPKSRASSVSFQKIKNHEYFAEFNWNDLLQEKILPPYIPKDFRSGKTEHSETTGEKFMQHLYNGKKYGKVDQWDEKFGI